MTQDRIQLIPPDTAGTYHCVQSCVRRAFLCGIDHYTHQSFEHRKTWVEDRLYLVAYCFAVAIHAYAVMSNHLHIVLQLDPSATQSWSDEIIAMRWVRLFPPREALTKHVFSKHKHLLRTRTAWRSFAIAWAIFPG